MSDLKTLYTAGYTGLTPDLLLAAATQLNALLIDIRYSPGSRHAQWRQPHLLDVWGDRYLHVRELGNANYDKHLGEGIRLADADAGTQRIVRLLADQPLILLCACAAHEKCHRTTVAQEMADRYGAEIVHLTADDIRQPPGGSLIEQLLLF